jgi:hypothetical protein
MAAVDSDSPGPRPDSRGPTAASRARFRLVDPDGRWVPSATPGTLGGHRRGRIYGRLDCPAALRAIARGGYVDQRVFFADEAAARAAGYRACAVCLPEAYAAWKTAHHLAD